MSNHQSNLPLDAQQGQVLMKKLRASPQPPRLRPVKASEFSAHERLLLCGPRTHPRGLRWLSPKTASAVNPPSLKRLGRFVLLLLLW
jgi:hypothetical protein